MTTRTTPPEDPNALEVNALQEIRGLLDHPLYQETHPPDTRPGKAAPILTPPWAAPASPAMARTTAPTA